MLNADVIKTYLNNNRIHWDILSGYFSSHDNEFVGTVKTVPVKIDGQYALIVLKKSEHIDIKRMKCMLHVDRIDIVQEDECQVLFPKCDATALPALGTLVDIPVYCSNTVLEKKEICFNTGTHDNVIKVPVDEFVELEHPTIGNFTNYGYNESKYDFMY